MKTLLLLAVLALFSLGSTEEGARLLASKSLLNRYAVEGRDLTLQYNIYNVGSRWGFGFDFWNELFFLCVCVLETNEEANLKKLTPKYCFNMMYVGLLFFKNYKKNIIKNQRFFFCLSVLPSRWSFPMIPFPLKTSELFQECWTWNGTGLPRILNLKWLSCCPITSSRSDFWCY